VTGKVTRSNSVIDRTTAPRSWIQPGAALFFAGLSGWNPTAGAVGGALLQKSLSGSVNVSLDAVTFDDGEFDGPDVANHYLELTIASAVRQDLFRELRLMSGSSDTDITARLKAITGEQPSAPPPSLRVDVRWRTRSRTATQLLLSISTSRGDFESMLDSKSFIVHRRS